MSSDSEIMDVRERSRSYSNARLMLGKEKMGVKAGQLVPKKLYKQYENFGKSCLTNNGDFLHNVPVCVIP